MRADRRRCGCAEIPLKVQKPWAREPVDLTATRLSELDLPVDWTEQNGLLAS
jgi:hypothetical protein